MKSDCSFSSSVVQCDAKDVDGEDGSIIAKLAGGMNSGYGWDCGATVEDEIV